MNDVKQQVLDEIEKHSEVFKKASQFEYRIRCPICGDSQSNPRDAHCYIRCSYDPHEPLLYNCFKCNSGGKVGRWFLEKLNVKPDVIAAVDNQKYNKITSVKYTDVNMLTGNPNLATKQVKYITERLGKGFTYEDYEKFKIIWDMNGVFPFVTSERVKNSIPSNLDSISFLSDDKSMILNRTLVEGEESQWRKLKIFPSENKAFYTIKTTIDLFTKDQIVVNIAEGVFDVLSVYKNFNDGDNSVFIAALGSDYISVVDHIIAKGIIGPNVTIKIYIDDGIPERWLKYQLKKYKWLFGNILVYKNIAYKDVGVSIDRIKLVEKRI